MLERMQRVWPSAWRAKELIHGSKVQALNDIVQSPERPKRTAESRPDDIPSENRHSNGAAYRPAPQVFTDESPTSSQLAYQLNMDTSHAESPATYYPQYSRWTPDGTISSMNGNLSTSVLPQTYSTGLVDERIQRHPDRHGRYPQYWNDYSSLGQMDPTYAMPVINDLSDEAQTGQPMYMPDQYSIYSASTVF